jgi:hypothetical protein
VCHGKQRERGIAGRPNKSFFIFLLELHGIPEVLLNPDFCVSPRASMYELRLNYIRVTGNSLINDLASILECKLATSGIKH